MIAVLQRCLIAAIIFDVPFHCDVHLAYDDFYASLNAIGGLQVSITSFAIFALYCMWFVELLLGRFWTRCSSSAKVSGWAIMYVCVSILSVLYAANRNLATFEVVLLVQTLLVYVFIVKRTRTREGLCFLVNTVMVSLFLQASLMLVSFVLGETVVLGPWTVWMEEQRAGGTVGSPNTAGSFLQLALAPCLCLALSVGKGWVRVVGGVACLVGLAGLLITFSRGAWLATVVSFALFVVLMGLRGWIPRKTGVLIGVCGGVLTVVSLGFIIERLGSEEAASLDGRRVMMSLASDILEDHALLGVGANNYAVVMDDYIRYPEYAGQWLHTVHNKYLLVWAELGVLGLLSFLGFLGHSLLCGWRVWQARDRALSPLALALVCGIVGQLVHMHLDLFHARPQVQLLWMLCAILVVMHHFVRNSATVTIALGRGGLDS